MAEVEEDDLAYIAGLFDGDGSVCISKGVSGSQGNKHRRSYGVNTRIGSTNLDVIKYCISKLGGWLIQPRRVQGATHQQMYYWGLSSRKAATMLRAILPFLKIKRNQAQLAIEFQEAIKSSVFPSKEFASKYKERVWHQMMSLNRCEPNNLSFGLQTGMREVKATDLAYIAGLFDAEGSITVGRYLYKAKGNPYVCYSLAAVVSNSNLNLLKFCISLLGGTIVVPHRGEKWPYKQVYYWKLPSRKAANMLRAILLHLKIKKRQAELAIEFQDAMHYTGKGHPRSEAEISDRERIRAEIMRLNHGRHRGSFGPMQVQAVPIIRAQ